MMPRGPVFSTRSGVASGHVGGTSVPGLAAKPIIDIDIVIPSRTVLTAVAPKIAPLCYLPQGDLGIAGREAFTTPPPTQLSNDNSPPDTPTILTAA